jgi:hypothetical protein
MGDVGDGTLGEKGQVCFLANEMSLAGENNSQIHSAPTMWLLVCCALRMDIDDFSRSHSLLCGMTRIQTVPTGVW